jgi:hypothetical protein
MKRLYTPQTPLAFFFLLSLFSLFSSNNTICQVRALEPLKSYELSLKTYYNRKWTADRREFKTLSMKGWYYYLPNVGFTFGLPSIQFGTKDYLNFRREKKINEARLEMLDSQAELGFNENLQLLRKMYESLNQEFLKVKILEEKSELKLKIWAITEEGYKKHEIPPKDYYLAKLEEMDFSEAKRLLEVNYNQKAIELEILAKWELPQEKLYFKPSECILESEAFDLFKEEGKIKSIKR